MHAADPSGTVYFCDASEHYVGVRTDTPDAEDQVLAGTRGSPGAIDASCRKARFHGPRAVSLDPTRRTLYVADTGNQAVRVVDLAVHIVNTLVDHHDARSAAGVPEFTPGGLALDADGLLAIADIKNHIVWAYDLRSHALRLLAGTPGQHGLTDGDGPHARFWLPTTVALAEDGSGFLVAEAGNRQRRHVTRDGRVRTLHR
jgi:sugar lactone lactonase YvrE